MMTSKALCSVFSVDVEDGVSIAMRDVFNKDVSQTGRVVQATEKILDLLSKHYTQATFFVLGQVAEVFPDLVKKISQQEHEIAVHGYNHLLFHQMAPKQAEEEISSAKKLLEDLTGQEVVGHRAPAFSISPNTAWAFEVLSRCGFKYDSSIMPLHSRRYGWPDFPHEPCLISDESNNTILEVPIRPMQLLGRTIPYSGGSYLRLLPFSTIKAGFAQHPNQSILYIHPYELDTCKYPGYYFRELRKQPLLTQLKMRSMWVNRKNTLSKLDQLLSTFDFSTMKNFITSYTQGTSLKEYKLSDLNKKEGRAVNEE